MNLDSLERTVRSHRLLAVGLFLTVVGAFALRHLMSATSCAGSDAEAWGQFGDFVGGLLNPVIAFLAFYWLTQSVLIQRTELRETKQALAESARAQSKHASHAERTVRVGALGSALDYFNAEIASLRHAIESVSAQRHKQAYAISPEGELLGNDKVDPYLFGVQQQLVELHSGREQVMHDLKHALKSEA